MMGDTVNLAARLESSAKQYGIYNFVGENIYKKAKEKFVFRYLDLVKVRGKNIPVKVYELVDYKDKVEDKTLELLKIFENGLNYYSEQNWVKASIQFKKAEELEDHFTSRNTTPSAVYIKRCTMFIENPPGKDWDGIWTMISK
jgi:adenylate cyclase